MHFNAFTVNGRNYLSVKNIENSTFVHLIFSSWEFQTNTLVKDIIVESKR